MIGAIIGDMVGSVFERKPIKTTDFKLINFGAKFTDDTVLTIAVADAIMNNKNYGEALRFWGQKYPAAGYGAQFRTWLYTHDAPPYNSWGNGSAMRVSAVGFAFNSLEKVLLEAQRSAECTHNHPEGIKGAQAIATAVFLARTGASKQTIKEYITAQFGYSLDRKLEEIRPNYKFDVSCSGSVPEAIISFLESTDYTSAIRLAISLGGDSDTQACMSGAIAEAFYGKIPEELLEFSKNNLPADILTVCTAFNTFRRKLDNMP